MTYEENGKKSVSYINALAKAKREMKKVDYDEMQTIEVANFVSCEYLLNKEEQAMLEKSLEKYVEKMNKIYSLPFEDLRAIRKESPFFSFFRKKKEVSLFLKFHTTF